MNLYENSNTDFNFDGDVMNVIYHWKKPRIIKVSDDLFLSDKEIAERKRRENYKIYLKRKSSKRISKIHNQHFKKRK